MIVENVLQDVRYCAQLTEILRHMGPGLKNVQGAVGRWIILTSTQQQQQLLPIMVNSFYVGLHSRVAIS